MTINIQVPESTEETLKQAFGANLERMALEALVVEGYRCGKLGIGQVRRLLGLESRWDAENWLGDHGVVWNYTLEDLEADRATLAHVLRESAE